MKGREAGKPARKNITETESMKRLSLVGFVHALSLCMLVLLVPRSASAITITDYFGPLDQATFGGTGIPNQEVGVAKQIIDGNIHITLALSATQRYSNPALTNNNAGTYFAGTGSNYGGNNESTTEGALWNFNFFMQVECVPTVEAPCSAPAPKLTDYTIDLFYDFDPAAAFSTDDMGKLDMDALIGAGAYPLGIASDAPLAQNSENLMFSWLATSVSDSGIDYVRAPTYTPFDPNVIGEYQFLMHLSGGNIPLETVAIEVQVVPVPPAVWLFGSGLIGLVGIARRKNSV